MSFTIAAVSIFASRHEVAPVDRHPETKSVTGSSPAR